MDMLKELEAWVEECGTAPLYEEMPRKTLADKGADGPTAAHALEEIHTPLNIAYTTYTTGTSASISLTSVRTSPLVSVIVHLPFSFFTEEISEPW